ncbi:MAG: glycosyltransferase family 2 protein [Patescibacteria group bacterium]|jgi:glycosyltransferase involved in cell wall biosynthesis|nr:glycosyltransferase family 2 protein [Patescibacteria group bacterium]
MKTAVVIPAYNESKIISQTIAGLRAQNQVSEVIVVDDGSADNTGPAARAAGAVVLRHLVNRGQGAALQTGINFALKHGAKIIITFDADGQHDAKEIVKMIEPIISGQSAVVLGSRFLVKQNQVPFSRLAVLKLAIIFTRIYTGLTVTDVHNGFRAFSAKAASQLDLRQDGMAHASEILEQIRKHRLAFCEVPVTIAYTDYSLHKGQRLSNSFRIVFELILGRLTK